MVGFGRVYPAVGYFAKWTQTVALLEVVHAATGALRCITFLSFHLSSTLFELYTYDIRIRAIKGHPIYGLC